MANFEHDFTRKLSEIHRKAMKLEAMKMTGASRMNLTGNEVHLIESIKLSSKNSEGPSISAIAAQFDITRPSATVAVNKLESKQIVEKNGCSSDGRSVRVKLTSKGDKMYGCIKRYNTKLAAALKEYFSEEEREQLADSFDKLSDFLNSMLSEAEG